MDSWRLVSCESAAVAATASRTSRRPRELYSSKAARSTAAGCCDLSCAEYSRRRLFACHGGL